MSADIRAYIEFSLEEEGRTPIVYFLWRNKPAAVLGKNGDWIPKPQISKQLEEVRFFDDPGEARYIQRSRYEKMGVSVLGEKSFKDKTHIKKLPVFCEAAPKQVETDRPGHLPNYCEYLDILCEGSTGHEGRVIFPPANKELTIGTPFMREVADLLNALSNYLAALDSKEARLREEIRQLDLLNSDRLHQVELFDLTDEESPAFVKALHDAQIERRRRKNELITLLLSKEALKQVDLASVRLSLRQIGELERQEYKCRVLNENDPFVQTHLHNPRKED